MPQRSRQMRRVLPVLALVVAFLVPVPALAADVIDVGRGAPQRALDGDPTTTERLFGRTPTATAIDVSQRRFDAQRRAAWVVLSRDDAFPDSLSASGLVGRGPLLFTATQALTPATKVEIDRVLDPGGIVYLLGGGKAIAPAVEQELREAGYRTVRLAGRTRIETSVAVATEVRKRFDRNEVLLARAFGPQGDDSAAWPDSVSGGGLAAAAGVPVLVTWSNAVHPAVRDWLKVDRPSKTVLLGGRVALEPAVEEAVPNPVRVAGSDRAGTAAAVAERLWGATTDGRRSFITVNGRHEQGWAFGLASAGVSADANAPLLLVEDDLTPDPTTGLNARCGDPEVDLAVVGDGAVVSPRVRERLDAFDGSACGPDGTLEADEGLREFDECGPLLAYIHENALERVGPWGLDGGVSIMPIAEPVRDEDGAATPEAAPAEGDASSSSGSGTSGTNVQEEGVDEPDMVETDGDIAVAVARNHIQIVDVSGDTPQLLSTVDLPEGAFGAELLLDGTDLLVLTRGNAGGQPEPEPLAVGDALATSEPASYEPTTIIRSIDLSIPSLPRIQDEVEFEGEYRSARMIDGIARLVIQSQPDGLPFVYPAEPSPEAEEAAAQHNREVVRESTIEDWLPSFVDCGDVQQPPWFSGFATLSVVTVEVGPDLSPSSSEAVLASGEVVYASAQSLYVTTSRWNSWEPDWTGASVTTEVHRFDISDESTSSYVASGKVPGYVLNQFSLSEQDGLLRIATTEEAPWGPIEEQEESESAVRVYATQGDELVEIGAVEGLGRGERIFAVRFLGDLGVVVTFRQIDPLHLVDLSDPTAPTLLGELKVPGYSAYLHRVGEDLLLGVGQDADEDGQVKGTQVSLFDISDRSAPQQVDTLTYAGAWSEVEHDHHAFLYWAPAGLAVVPISVFDEMGPSFQGAVGVDVAAAGLAEAGQVTHPADSDEERWMAQIRRSFVADGQLYTVSELGIGKSDLATLELEAFEEFSG